MTDHPNESQAPPKKIIIDEDWKSQVEAEKDALKRGAQEQQGATQAQGRRAEIPLPPPSLGFLGASLAAQAMMAMGLAPHPLTGKPQVDLEQAKHSIDTIAMLFEKTEGNRTPEETAELDNLLHELRMAFVAVSE